MRVKKYPQSNLIITQGTAKIAIDPGVYTFQQGFTPGEFADCQAILITHAHADHLDLDNIKAVVGNKLVFGNADVAAKLNGFGIEIVEVGDGQEFKAGEFLVKAVNLPHCKMADGSDGPPNTGFMIEGVLFHPGDGDEAPDGLTSENVALPIAGPSITTDGSLQFAKDIQARVIIPIHYDSKFPADLTGFTKRAKEAGMEVRNLNPGEETEI